ncbi:hypothetical protein HK099_003191, partial [Clydaea vesicula]
GVITYRFREQDLNRIEARKLLKIKLDEFYNKENSISSIKIKKMQLKKKRKEKRSKEKYGANQKDEE